MNSEKIHETAESLFWQLYGILDKESRNRSDVAEAKRTALGHIIRKGKTARLGLDRVLRLTNKYGGDQFEVTLDIKIKTGRPDVTGQPEV
jgi:hypothetical protein